MSDALISPPRSVPRFADEAPKPVRKSQPAQFPHRITFCMADDQIENLQQVKRAYRASESFVLRMAFDTFCRTNGFPVNGGNNGR
jgi:hypothetical protein